MPATRSGKTTFKKVAKGPKHVECIAWWCSKTFNRKADMRRHAMYIHLGFFYKCLICGHKGAQNEAIETHISNAHTRVLTSLCSCGRGFTDPSALSKHRKESRHLPGPRTKPTFSGATAQGREPSTQNLTYKLIMDTPYEPASLTEDTFSFISASVEAACADVSRSPPPTCSGDDDQAGSSLTPFPTSMYSLPNFATVESLVHASQPYDPPMKETWDTPHSLDDSLCQMLPHCGLSTQPLQLDTRAVLVNNAVLQPLQEYYRTLEYPFSGLWIDKPLEWSHSWDLVYGNFSPSGRM